MNILEKHKTFLDCLSHKYRFLGREDIYNELVVYLLEAYQENKDPEPYAKNKLRQYIRKEKKNKEVNYGLNPKNIRGIR